MRLLLVLFVVFVVGCKKAEERRCFKSSGKVITETRPAIGFKKIEVDDRVNLFIKQGNEEELVVEGGDNMLFHIKTEVSDSVLSIQDENTCAWTRNYGHEINAYVTVKQLREIRYASAGNLTFLTPLVADTFTLEQWDGSGTVALNLNVNTSFLNQHTGSADLFCTGTSNRTFLYTTTSSPMNCLALSSNWVFASNLGVNDIQVHANDKIIGNVHESGNIYYSGNPPEVVENISGSGQVKKIQH